MKTSFLIPAWNAERTLENAVRSIATQRANGEKEIIIIDDGSTDRTLAIAEQCRTKYPGVSVFTKKNGGEASALNYGLQKATGDFIALVEADVELEPGWLEKIAAGFDDAAVVGAGGRLVTSENEPWIARIAGYEIEQKFDTKERYPVHITSAGAMYRAKAFAEAGGFDEKLINASLDSDFNGRLVSLGHKLLYVKEATVFHHYKATLGGYLSRNYSYARYRFYVKNAFLYPSDRFLAINIMATGFFILSLCLLRFFIIIPAMLFLVLILLQMVPAIALFRSKKDPVLFLYPLVAVLRNIVAAAGLVVGALYAAARKPPSAE